jgi:hypothetical protein
MFQYFMNNPNGRDLPQEDKHYEAVRISVGGGCFNSQYNSIF